MSNEFGKLLLDRGSMLAVEAPRAASAERPAASAVFRPVYAPNGVPELQGASTCYQLFQ